MDYRYRNIKIKFIGYRKYVDMYVRENIFSRFEKFDAPKDFLAELWDEIKDQEKRLHDIISCEYYSRHLKIIEKLLSKVDK